MKLFSLGFLRPKQDTSKAHIGARFSLAVLGTFWVIFSNAGACRDISSRYGRRKITIVLSISQPLFQQRRVLPGRNQQIYVSQPSHSFFPEPFDKRWRTNFKGAYLLFLANTYKKIGLLDVAATTYRLAEQEVQAPDMALVGLADLWLMEGNWTIEADSHLEAGEILDESLAESMLNCSRAWQRRPITDCISELRKALAINPSNKTALWLLSCALLKMKDWSGSLGALKAYLELAPAHYDQNIANSVAAYGQDSGEGVKRLKQNFGRWFGWFRVSEVEIVGAQDIRDRALVPHRTLLDSKILKTEFNVVAKGEISHYTKNHLFGEILSYEIKEAEILPVYGMVVCDNTHMLEDTSHTFRTHWHRYTPAVISIKENRALIARETAPIMEIEGAIFFGSNTNYYHYICEDIPRLLLLDEQPGNNNRPVLVRHDLAEWQQILLAKLNIASERWRAVNFNSPLKAKNVTTSSLLSRDLVAHPYAIQLVRQKLLVDEENLKPRKGKRLYLKRGAKRDRGTQFLNEDVIESLLHNAGFVSVTTGSMSLEDQMLLFADAEIVAGAGGAALTNIIFAPRECASIVFASAYDSGGTFSSLAAAIGQDYYACLGDGYAQPSPSWIHTSFDFSIDPKDVEIALSRIEARRN